jgi:orotate phosphoribosyltransferase
MDADYQVMSQDYKTHLLEVLYARSFKYDKEKGFLLSSGARSDFYIDAKKTVLSAEGMELVGYTFFQELKLEPVDGVGGLTLGADPIAYATALTSTTNGKLLDVFLIRKEPKKHGTQSWVEGNLMPGAWVAIVDDVVTTGASVITAIERARESGFQVRRVMALVDREEGGKENIEAKTGCKFEAIFTKTEIMEFHKKMTTEAEKATQPRPRAERPVF